MYIQYVSFKFEVIAYYLFICAQLLIGVRKLQCAQLECAQIRCAQMTNAQITCAQKVTTLSTHQLG